MSKIYKECPIWGEKFIDIISNIQMDIREIKTINSNMLESNRDHFLRVDTLQGNHAVRIGLIEKEVIRFQTIIAVLPWASKVLWGMLGGGIIFVVWIIIKAIPYLPK